MNNKITKTLVGFALLILLFVFACQKQKEDKDSILEGKASVLVDDSVLPIIEDEEAVFETEYSARLHLISKSENEIVNSLLNDTVSIAIMARGLSQKEIKAFQSRKINPIVTPFATDAVAFIKNRATNDSLIALQDVIDFIAGKPVPAIKGIVFDNANSSTVRSLANASRLTIENQENIFSLKTNEDAIKYVAENTGMIGVVGIDWILQPSLDLEDDVQKVRVLGVKGVNKAEFIFPTQDNLATGSYPLARRLYIVNCQGYSGLGMGFGSFLTGERGQRIVLKSGLLPERTPGRKIVVRNTISKENK